MEREPMLRRRAFLGNVALAGTAAMLGIRSGRAAAEPPPETTRIRIHDSAITCFAPEFPAVELLKAEGFTDIQFIKTPLAEGPNEALAAGKIDMTMNDTAAFLMGLDSGMPITLLAGIHTGCWELFGHEPIRSLRDLKGRTVAAPDKSSRQAFVAAMVASVGLDPRKDIKWINHEPQESMRLFAEGKIDALMGFAPEPQELRSKKIGRVLLNTLTDRPWSQYFCCLAGAHQDFVRKHPVATKRALRALLKTADLCVSQPATIARMLVDRGVASNYDYTLQSVREIGYRKWREYDPEDTVRFWGLRLQELGIVKTSPKKVIAENTNWRFINELRKELKA